MAKMKHKNKNRNVKHREGYAATGTQVVVDCFAVSTKAEHTYIYGLAIPFLVISLTESHIYAYQKTRVRMFKATIFK